MKKDYTDFDRFIKAEIEDDTITFDMPDTKLREVLRNLGVHRVKVRSGRYAEVENRYPTQQQLDHVKEVRNRVRPTQKTIPISSNYTSYKSYGRVSKGNIIHYDGKTYRGGMFLPKRFLK